MSWGYIVRSSRSMQPSHPWSQDPDVWGQEKGRDKIRFAFRPGTGLGDRRTISANWDAPDAAGVVLPLRFDFHLAWDCLATLVWQTAGTSLRNTQEEHGP